MSGIPAPSVSDRDALTVQVDLVTATIAVTGELDRERVHLLVDATATLASTLHRSWVLDASAISFCDAGGLRAVVAAAEITRRRGGELTVIGATRSLRRLLTIVGLVDVLPGGAGPGTPGGQNTAAGSPSVLPFRTRERPDELGGGPVGTTAELIGPQLT